MDKFNFHNLCHLAEQILEHGVDTHTPRMWNCCVRYFAQYNQM